MIIVNSSELMALLVVEIHVTTVIQHGCGTATHRIKQVAQAVMNDVGVYQHFFDW